MMTPNMILNNSKQAINIPLKDTYSYLKMHVERWDIS